MYHIDIMVMTLLFLGEKTEHGLSST